MVVCLEKDLPEPRLSDGIVFGVEVVKPESNQLNLSLVEKDANIFFVVRSFS